MDGDDWRPPASTWYHEAGHAVAAILGGGHVDYMEFGYGEIVTCAPVEGRSNQAFKIWAGPWAQVYKEDGGDCSIARISGLFHTQSFFDWPLYEYAMDPARAKMMDIEGFAADMEFALMFPECPTKRNLDNLPPVSAPDASWHDRLRSARHEIEQLAESLMNGESPVTLSNAQVLVRYGDFDYWYDPNRLDDPRPHWIAE